MNHNRREFERTRGGLQQTATQNAHNTLQQVSGRETEYVKHVLHSVANGIVDEARRYNCTTIVFEELAGIRGRLPEAPWHAEWAFNRLLGYVKYKAAEHGIAVVETDPRNTSKRCAECGFVADANRPSRDTFECQQCGNRNHADYNAAKNVADMYLRREQQSSGRRGISQYALKSGVMTSNREFIPYSTDVEVETESTDKPHPHQANPSG